MAGVLADHGIRREDRVLMAVPDGPAGAVALLSVMSNAICVPVNGSIHRKELIALIESTEPGLVMEAQRESSVRDTAAARELPVVEVPAIASHNREPESADTSFDFPCPDDIALMMPTSGTTSRPKIVPLTHGNLCASARFFARSYGLNMDDRCLNCMPLFHIHGLMAGVLASVLNGGCSLCAPRNEIEKVFEWLETYEPTWITGVPTFYQALLEAPESSHSHGAANTLRFLRSASASLPPVTMSRLEKRFGVPVLESYAMTEAAAHVSVNPPPPKMRKPGSVGLPAGPEVRVVDERGRCCALRERGEIEIRGGNVIQAYFGDAELNRELVRDGWLRTGDQGYFDDEGYLYITGRFKELIVRGGYNIAPREIEDCLNEHPDVLQSAAFAVPHPTLGQDAVCAVVVRRDVSEGELRGFLSARLTDFKVPSRVVKVQEIPKAPNGKVQRARLSEQLAEELEQAFVPPEGEIEEILAEIWKEALRVDRISRNDGFFSLGGDSLLATQTAVRVQERLGVSLKGEDVISAMRFSDLVEKVIAAMIHAAGAAEVLEYLDDIESGAQE